MYKSPQNADVHVTPKSVMSPQNSAVRVTPHRPKSVMEKTSAATKPLPVISVQPQKVELVEGYGVYLTQRQLDEVVDSSGDVPTRLMRNLLATFFTPDILSKSSALGKGKHPALEPDILGACIKYVQSKCKVSRSILIDCANDKCANFRRKLPKVEA